jgi:hypothetical protein
MLLLAVQKQQLALDTQRERKPAAKEKLEHAHNERKSLIKYTAQIRGEEKAKDLAMKEQMKQQKLDKATSRVIMAASAMNHQNYADPQVDKENFLPDATNEFATPRKRKAVLAVERGSDKSSGL